jgi:hypothetical protein
MPRSVLAIVGVHEKEGRLHSGPVMFAENTIIGRILYRPETLRSVIDAMARGSRQHSRWVTTVPLVKR